MIDRQHRSQLAVRRELLVQSARQQRTQLATAIEPVVHAVAWADRADYACRTLSAHPGVVLATLALLLAWRPRALVRAGAGALTLWKIAHSVRLVWRMLRAWRA